MIYLAYLLNVLTANITLAWPQSSVLLTTRDDINAGKHTSALTTGSKTACPSFSRSAFFGTCPSLVS